MLIDAGLAYLATVKISRFDLLNTSLAALRDGPAALYNLYLVTRLGFSPIEIGWILSAPSAAALFLQVPLGFIYDRLPRPGLAIAAGSLLLSLIAFTLGWIEHPSMAAVMVLQIFYGIANSTLAAGVPALTVSRNEGSALGRRLARNEICAKIGNLSTVALGGWLAQVIPLRIIFFGVPLLALPVVYLSFGLGGPKPTRVRLRTVGARWWTSTSFYLFGLIVLTLFFANTAALAMFEQVFSRSRADGGAGWIATVAIVTQACVTLTILGLGRVHKPRWLTWTLVAAFVMLILRLFTLATGPSVPALLVGQVLDGVLDGVVLTVPARLLAHRHPSDFNVLSGVLGSVASLAAMGSTLASGPLMTFVGYPAALWPFAACAAVGLGLALVTRRRLARVSNQPLRRRQPIAEMV